MLGRILGVGAEGNAQGGDVGALRTVDQKDVVAAGTVRKSGLYPEKEPVSAVSHKSSVTSPGLKVSDPMLEVGDGSCDGNIPPPPGVPRHAHTAYVG